jgi:SAM-dependent methyltransferase
VIPVPTATHAAHNRRQRRYFERTVKRTMVPTDSPYLRRHVDELRRFAALGPADRVLEVGCGMGRYTLLLAQRGVRVEGLDLSPVLLDRLVAYNAGRFAIPLHCADVLQPPAHLAGRFEAVVGFFTLHHVDDLEACFLALARLLRPGGRLAFLEPNPLNPLYYAQILATPGMTARGERGLARMRPRRIARALHEAGLGQFRLARFGFLPPALANRALGPGLEARLERVPLWRALLPFQLFGACRP